MCLISPIFYLNAYTWYSLIVSTPCFMFVQHIHISARQQKNIYMLKVFANFLFSFLGQTELFWCLFSFVSGLGGRWVNLILKKAKVLRQMALFCRYVWARVVYCILMGVHVLMNTTVPLWTHILACVHAAKKSTAILEEGLFQFQFFCENVVEVTSTIQAQVQELC